MTITTVTATTHSGQPITEWAPPAWAASTQIEGGGFSYATETPAVPARTIEGNSVSLSAEMSAMDALTLHEADWDQGYLEDRLTIARTAPEVAFAGLTLTLDAARTFAVELLGMLDQVPLDDAAPARVVVPTSYPTEDPAAARRTRMLGRITERLASGPARRSEVERLLFDSSRRKEARDVIDEAVREGSLSLTDGVLSLPADDVRPALKAVR